jgi:hypothetical protein
MAATIKFVHALYAIRMSRVAPGISTIRVAATRRAGVEGPRR